MRLDLPLLDARLDAFCAGSGTGDGTANGTVSVWLGTTDGAPLWTRDEHASHYAASTMKLPLVMAAQRLVVRGDLDPDRPVPVYNLFRSAADGSPFSLDESEDQDPETWAALGATRTVAELAEHAVIHSGNLPTNLLLDLVGVHEVAEVLRLAGCSPTTVVMRGIEDFRAREAGLTNTVTAHDLALLMAAVARRDAALGGEPVLGPVEAVLARQTHVDQIPAGLPAGTRTASKSGWIPGVSHDACLVRPAGREPFVLTVCTTIDLPEDEAARLVASVARDLWEAMPA